MGKSFINLALIIYPKSWDIFTVKRPCYDSPFYFWNPLYLRSLLSRGYFLLNQKKNKYIIKKKLNKKIIKNLNMAESEQIARHFMDLDKICFEKCISNPEKKFSVKDENCLSKFNSLILI